MAHNYFYRLRVGTVPVLIRLKGALVFRSFKQIFPNNGESAGILISRDYVLLEHCIRIHDPIFVNIFVFTTYSICESHNIKKSGSFLL